MKIINPTTVNDAALVSSTVVEDDYSEWSSGTPYTTGDRVIVTASGIHRRYEAMTDTTGDYPPDNISIWLDLGPTNRWAMFDAKVGTQTSDIETITVELDAGLVTGLALLNLSAVDTVEVVLTDPGEGEVYNETISMWAAISAANWYAYFFDDVGLRTSVVLTDLPSYYNATVEVTITGATGSTVAIGAMIVGKLNSFAVAANQGSSFGIMDYSRKDTDDFGNYIIVERAFSKRADLSVLIENSDLDKLFRLLSALRATPAVYVASSAYDSTVIFGFSRDWSTVISYPENSELSIQIEGLI